MNETKKRTIARVISWRCVTLVTGTITTYLVLGDVSASVEVMIWANIVSTIAFYIHERFWSGVSYGRHPRE